MSERVNVASAGPFIFLNTGMIALQIFDIVWMLISLSMSAALCKTHPELSGWQNVSRSMAWPITLYEVKAGLI